MSRTRTETLRLLLAATLTLFVGGASSLGVTPDSPEVIALIDKGIAFLDKEGHEELGGKCLVAIAYHKRGMPASHPRIAEALNACKAGVESERERKYDYGKCLAIIFLAGLDNDAHRGLIDQYVALLREHQKPHGGFGYIDQATGDTSQTQYAALAYWEMMNHGLSPDATSVQQCLGWIMRTRDPTGVWGYQAQDPGTGGKLVTQGSNPGVSMAAAGMCTTMLLGNCVGLLNAPNAVEELGPPEDLPPALRREAEAKKVRAPPLPAGDISGDRVMETLAAGRAWLEKNFTFDVSGWQSYYLYSVERYRSFEEYLSGQRVEEPDWYNAGFERLKKSQLPDGSWNDSAGSPAATAFSILFLLRSTQKSIEASLGQGTLVGGRGLPRDLSKVKLRGGKMVVEHNPTQVDQLLGLLDDSKSDALDALLDDPAALEVSSVEPDQARRLQQVVRSGPAGARLLAVRALGKLRDVDHAPTLIFALTDPDKRVVREARDGLRSISRNFEGFGPPDNFDEDQRGKAVERWKAWYRTIRPDAPPLP